MNSAVQSWSVNAVIRRSDPADSAVQSGDPADQTQRADPLREKIH